MPLPTFEEEWSGGKWGYLMDDVLVQYMLDSTTSPEARMKMWGRLITQAVSEWESHARSAYMVPVSVPKVELARDSFTGRVTLRVEGTVKRR